MKNLEFKLDVEVNEKIDSVLTRYLSSIINKTLKDVEIIRFEVIDVLSYSSYLITYSCFLKYKIKD
jgi:hypothetical protein